MSSRTTAPQARDGAISAASLRSYLAAVLNADVRLVRLQALGGEGDTTDPKAFGYGEPFEVDCLVDAVPRAFVIARTRPAKGFGHDYPADRAWQALWAHEAYNTFPDHVRSVDVGVIRRGGALESVTDALEFFQLVEKAEGRPYWLDLDRLVREPLDARDVARTEALARFLARVHALRRDEPTLYHRRLRELVGHGECLMGILDSYSAPCAALPPDICEELERNAVAWRWRLHGRSHRLARVHGDFHPWNILFREGVDFSVLDRSRGDWGEPADDVAALGINYLLYGLSKQGASSDPDRAEPFGYLFRTFLEVYLSETNDRELPDVIPPFLGFRAVVLAHPRWYPTLSPSIRGTLIRFARRMMAGTSLDPRDVEELFGAVR